MRRRVGDIIHVTDGKGTHYEARITSEDHSQCGFEIISQHQQPDSNHSIHIAISPLSHPDRLEWFVEKAVEIGVNQITLVSCERTEKRQVKSERLHKIAIGAMKQSQRFTLPLIEGPMPFEKFVASCQSDLRFIAYVDAGNPAHLFGLARKGKSHAVCIGPEGDFTDRELKQALDVGFVKVSLGPHRLRTETAGLAACHMLNLVNLG